MKRVLIITPFPLAQNPRAYKEYNLLKENNFNVKVVYAERDKWASSISLNNDDFILVGGKFGSYFYQFTRIFSKISKPFLPLELTYNRASFFLFVYAYFYKADLYIGHNLAALPITVLAAERNKAKSGFDAEDFHRNETSDSTNDSSYIIAKKIEDKYLSRCSYNVVASPLIKQAYQKLYPSINTVVINNVFEKRYLQGAKNGQNDVLKLFWFSQTIGEKRGIEEVIEALNLLNNKKIELHLLGKSNKQIEDYFLGLKSTDQINIYFYSPISPDQIFSFASNFDIGLALEVGKPFNRDICLTNKIFSYLTSGLAIVASDTKAQTKFLADNYGVGFIYPTGDIEKLAELINNFFVDRSFLYHTKAQSISLAKATFNWEKESKLLMGLINEIIKS